MKLHPLNDFKGIYSTMGTQDGQEKLGTSFLLLNATETEAVEGTDGSDVWETVSLHNRDYNFNKNFQITLCMTAFQAQNMEIHATRAPPIAPEPALIWNKSTRGYVTEAIQQQLGASKSTTERGIFDLAPTSWQILDQRAVEGAFASIWALDYILNADIYRNQFNEAQYSILSHMVSSTSNPALSLQAFFTILFAISYYDRIVLFDQSAPSSQVSLVQVIRPLGWTAYIVVVSIITFHLTLVSIVIWIFYRTGKQSRIGNSWSVVSQLLGPTTEYWIRDTDTVNDETVKSWLKDRDLNPMVQIEEIRGHVQLVQKRIGMSKK